LRVRLWVRLWAWVRKGCSWRGPAGPPSTPIQKLLPSQLSSVLHACQLTPTASPCTSPYPAQALASLTPPQPHTKMMMKPERAQDRPRICTALQVVKVHNRAHAVVDTAQSRSVLVRQHMPVSCWYCLMVLPDRSKRTSEHGKHSMAHLWTWNHSGSQRLACLAVRMPRGMSTPHPTTISQPCACRGSMQCAMQGSGW